MYDLLLEQFENFASQFPGIFDPYCRRRTEGHSECVSVEYVMPYALTIGEVTDLLCKGDMVLQLFQYRPTQAVEYGQRASFYSLPMTPIKFKADVRTNERGICKTIRVTIYGSIEQMRHDTMSDYEKTSQSGGVFKGRDFREVQLDFM